MHGVLQTDQRFMTNADVPLIAWIGIVDNSVNPWTDRPISDKIKEEGVFITTNLSFMEHEHGQNVFHISDDEWVHVHDTIFDKNNWSETAWSEADNESLTMNNRRAAVQSIPVKVSASSVTVSASCGKSSGANVFL